MFSLKYSVRENIGMFIKRLGDSPYLSTLAISRPTHKTTCSAEGSDSRILKMAGTFMANPIISCFLQLYFIIEFNLLRNRCADTPISARLEIGIEPLDVTVFMKLLYGADIGTNVDGMFQINAITPDKSKTPLISPQLETWQNMRNSNISEGFASDPIAIVNIHKDSNHGLCFPLHIREPAFAMVRRADPFVKISALTGAKTEIPMTAMSCIE